MAITYPLTFPATKGTREVSLRMVDIVGVFRSSFTGQEQVQAQGGDWWEATVTMPPMVRADAEAFAAFLGKLRGTRGTFLMGVSSAGTARGSPAGTPVLDSVSADGYTIQTSGWTTGITGVLLAGDYISIQHRLYKVLDNANSNGSGEADLEIWPRIRPNASPSDAITFTNPKGIWRLADNLREFRINVDQHYGFTFVCEEALRI